MKQPRKHGKPPTLEDVAQYAGVAKSTISRVMSNDPSLNIRQDTRDRIRQAVEHLRYVPNSSARNLRTARSWSTAFVVPELDNPIFIQTMQGAQAALIERHYSMLIAHIDVNRPDRELYRRMVSGNRVEGLLVNTIQDAELLADLRRLNTQYILVNRHTDQDEHYVILDNEGGVGMAMDYLVALGHRRIGYISGPTQQYASERRYAGYLAALEAHNIAYDPGIFGVCQYDRDGAEAEAHRMLAQPDRPTAIVASNLVIASGITTAANALGLGVPEKLSIVALNDGPSAVMMTPQITAVRFPLFELGWTAATELISLIEGKVAEPIRRVLPAEKIVIRQSTAPAPQTRRRKAG
ncbi:LacI family DNA-binding transcriptional regulator [Oceanibaculum pacificum]|uniref:LacI family DNA-binding transcriptional regulator n=1 Tax=Oceanibaculum pacificum TaxID=580166 RepID=UPI0009FD4477|nr:LacI family DNA-binding transcriptional regulator [Oceanibaculum pacificum]